MTSPSNVADEKEWKEYFSEPYTGAPAKNSVLEFFTQLGQQAVMHGGGGIGSLWQGLHNVVESAPTYSGKPRTRHFPESPLPTVESIGKKIGYEEPTTAAGRIGGRIGTAVGSAIPFAAGTVATGGLAPAAALIGTSAAGGLAGGAAKELGAPESVATGIDIATNLSLAAKQAFTKVLKPSGMAERGFEAATKPIKMTPQKYQSMVKSIEEETKGLTEKLFSKNKTYQEIKDSSGKFFDDLDAGFLEIENVSHRAPYATIGSTGDELKKSINKRMAKQKFAPITKTERDKSYLSTIKEKMEEIDPKKKFTIPEYIKQTRANNEDLRGYFEATSSASKNKGTRDALLDYGRSLSDEIDRKIPNSRLAKLIKKTNKDFHDKANIEDIEEHIEKLFTGDKVNYKQARKYFDDKNLQFSIRSTFGDAGEKEFRQIMKDLLGQQRGMGKISIRQSHIYDPRKWLSHALSAKASLPKPEIKKTVKKMLPFAATKAPEVFGEGKKRKLTMDEILSS